LRSAFCCKDLYKDTQNSHTSSPEVSIGHFLCRHVLVIVLYGA